MFNYKVPFYYLIITTLSGVIFSYIIFQTLHKDIVPVNSLQAREAESAHVSCDYSLSRLEGYKFIKPLVRASQSCESEKYIPLKTQVSGLIENYRSNGTITSASFYLLNLKQGEWASINPEEKFDPGSLMKVPLMITILHMSEQNPGLLDRKVLYERPFAVNRNPVFTSETIKLGNKYTVRELLKSMIMYSDNEATCLLCDQTDMATFKKTFSDFGFPEIDSKMMDYPITSANFSAFMEALYDAGYLTIRDSEYATSLLSGSTFREGILSGLPESIQVAHKFGEAGDEQMHQLHESGIIYYNNSPYLLTVMTKGTDIKKLPAVIAGISKSVYDSMGQVN